ncbi:MAG: hypothetical protein HC806_08810 [Anaerolineae bacterium]|nr:hypothetical protein [Anaerolineae bacterium]
MYQPQFTTIGQEAGGGVPGVKEAGLKPDPTLTGITEWRNSDPVGT